MLMYAFTCTYVRDVRYGVVFQAVFLAGLVSIGICFWISFGSSLNDISWQAPVMFTNIAPVELINSSNMSCTAPEALMPFESLRLVSALSIEQGPYYITQGINR